MMEVTPPPGSWRLSPTPSHSEWGLQVLRDSEERCPLVNAGAGASSNTPRANRLAFRALDCPSGTDPDGKPAPLARPQHFVITPPHPRPRLLHRAHQGSICKQTNLQPLARVPHIFVLLFLSSGGLASPARGLGGLELLGPRRQHPAAEQGAPGPIVPALGRAPWPCSEGARGTED